MKFRLLGKLEVDADGVDLTPVRPQQRALLALLLLRVGEVVAIDALVEGLWGPRPPETAQKALHGHISALRKRLGSKRIETRPPGYRLRLAGGDELDAHRFEQIVAAARTDGPSARSRKLREGLALFRGEPLSDFRYEEFAVPEAVRLEELQLTVIEEQIEADLELARHAEVVPQLERLVVDHPLRERMRAQLMLALYRAGRQADALQAFKEARTLLVDGLGIEPSPALQDLERQILNHDPALGVPNGFVRARRRASARFSLPAQATSLIGREREIREVTDLLQRPEVRLVTLTGTGGTGKTRVAIQVAAGLLDDFADGVVFIGLAPLQDPDLVLTTAAQALGLRTTGGEALEVHLRRHLRSRQLLLVLDNFEHVVKAAPLVTAIAATAPDVKLLATSRVPLRLSAERVYPISSLEMPASGDDLERLSQCESVALFETRAQSVQPDFAVTPANVAAVADICRALDGLPLAIELAATRVGALPPAALRQRLDHRLKLLVGGAQDAPERHRTLRATIDWSYDLLEPTEQRLFMRLAVFLGGCTIEAAQSVCGDDHEIVDGLASLTDKGLTRLEGTDEEPRFLMLETIREYALERLREFGSERLDAPSEREIVRRLHADFYFALAHRAEPELEQSDQIVWLDRLEAELDNLRAALDYAQDAGRAEDALRAFIAIRRFLDLRVHVDEVRRRSETLLSVDQPPALRAAGLRDLIQAALLQGNADRAWELAEERLELYRALNDDVGVHWTLQGLATIASSRGDFAQAHALITPVVDWARGRSDYELTYTLETLTDIAYHEGKYNEMLATSEEALAVYERHGDAAGLAFAQGRIGCAYLYLDRLNEALPYLRMSLLGWHVLSNVAVFGSFLPVIALVASMRGESQRAARLLGKADELIVTAGRQRDPRPDTPDKRAIASAREALGQNRFEAAYLEGRAMSLDDALGLGLEVLDDA